MQTLHELVTDSDIAEEFRIMFERPIAYHSYFADLFGVCAAVFLSQALYWSKIKKGEDGWFYKTREDWKYETGLTRDEQETSRKKLVKFGVLEEKLGGNPARMYYRTNLQPLANLFRKSLERDKAKNSVGGKAPNKMVGKHPTKLAENNPTIYTETTTENTTNKEFNKEFEKWLNIKKEKKALKNTRAPNNSPAYPLNRFSKQPPLYSKKVRTAAYGENIL